MLVTVATKIGFKLAFTLITCSKDWKELTSSGSREAAAHSIFLGAAANHKDGAKNNQDCQKPKQVARNWDRTLKFTSLAH